MNEFLLKHLVNAIVCQFNNLTTIQCICPLKEELENLKQNKQLTFYAALINAGEEGKRCLTESTHIWW